MDRQTFLIKLEKHIVSDDETVRKFMLNILSTSFIGDESTFMLGLEANTINRTKWKTNAYLNYLKKLPMSAEGVRRLLSDLRAEPMSAEQANYYLSLLNHADPCLVDQFQDDISLTLKEKGIKVPNLSFYTNLCSDSKDAILQKLQGVIRNINASEPFNYNHFLLGKQMIEWIAKRGLTGENEILYRLSRMKKRSKLTVSDLYDIVLAGDMQIEAAIPNLLALLKLHYKDEISSEEVVNSLVKIGTDNVVDLLQPLIDDKHVCFHVIDVLSNIKTDYAKKILLKEFKQTKRRDAKTLIAASLCEHFSQEAIPLIEAYIDEGYETWLLTLEEYLYCNCIVNGVNHPKLSEWKHAGQTPGFGEVELEPDTPNMIFEEQMTPGKQGEEASKSDGSTYEEQNIKEESRNQSELYSTNESPANESTIAVEENLERKTMSTISEAREKNLSSTRVSEGSKQEANEVSNKEMRAAMQRLLKAREDNELQKKLQAVGRNSPCPCGSGKKFKKCCIGKIS
ncbi:SEC-C metal-binding domain-containing protein [Salipaludibacillus sp. HK11]|uniref:SEC-C metal-binding domain-containing protein n=1 Tax=Salipaludibacillus sp. HK11 TaxID=3394320 RepID=UPI0039FCEB31